MFVYFLLLQGKCRMRKLVSSSDGTLAGLVLNGDRTGCLVAGMRKTSLVVTSGGCIIGEETDGPRESRRAQDGIHRLKGSERAGLNGENEGRRSTGKTACSPAGRSGYGETGFARVCVPNYRAWSDRDTTEPRERTKERHKEIMRRTGASVSVWVCVSVHGCYVTVGFSTTT